MWQMNRISKNTLLNISKYSNKLIKWAKYVLESNQPIIISELSNLGNLTDQIQLIEAFDKDLSKNVNDLYELQKLIITTKEDGTIPELNGEEKNLKTLFGTNYDEKERLLNLPALTLSIDNPIQKDEIKARIIKSFLGIDPKEYKLLLKTKDKLKEIEVSSLNETKDKINYVINKADIDFVSTYTKKIADLVNSIFDIRKNLDLEEKDLIDTRITSGRTMIDGVLENSTYISKREGIYNISQKHKGQEDTIEKIYQGVKDSGYISGVEIDQDTDLNKVLFLINQIKDLHLNIDKEFEFKIRKLGNYRYNGVYLHNDIEVAEFGFSSNVLNIVSVDVNAPTALVHELVHLIDLSNEEFLNSQNRKNIINHFTKVLNNNGIKDFYQKSDYEYLLKGNEIIARLGEIGYILNKYDYRGHETQEDLFDFFDKVKECQKLEEKGVIIPNNLSEIDFELFKQKQYLIKKFDSTFINENEKFIPVTKDIDFYRKNKKSFFDIENLTQEELLLIKEYSKSYFNVIKKDFLKLDNLEMLKQVYQSTDEEELEDKPKEKQVRKKYITDDFIFSKINTLNIDNVLKELDKNEVISWSEFLNEYGSQRHHLFRTSFSLNNDKQLSQIELNNKIVDHLIKNDDKDNLANFISSYMLGMSGMSSSYKNIVYRLNKDIKRPENKDITYTEESFSKMPLCIKKALNHLNIKELDYNLNNFKPQLQIDQEGLKSTFSQIEENLQKFKPNTLAFVRILWGAMNKIEEYNKANYYINTTVEKHVSSIINDIDIEKLKRYGEKIDSEILRHNEPLLKLCKEEAIKCVNIKTDYLYTSSYNNDYGGRYSFVKFSYLNENFIKDNMEEILNAIDTISLNTSQIDRLKSDPFIFIKENLSFKHLKNEEAFQLIEKLKIEDISNSCKILDYNKSYTGLSNNLENNCNQAEKSIVQEMLRTYNNKPIELYIEEYKNKVNGIFLQNYDKYKYIHEKNTVFCNETKDFYLKIIKQLIDNNQLDNFNKSLVNNDSILKEIKTALNLNPQIAHTTEDLMDSYKKLTMSRSRGLKI